MSSSVPPSRTPSWSASSRSCSRRSPIRAASSASSERPVRISTSDAISSPTRCSSSGVPWRQPEPRNGWSGTGSRDRDREPSSTATSKSCADLNASRAVRSSSPGPGSLSAIAGEGQRKGFEQPIRYLGLRDQRSSVTWPTRAAARPGAPPEEARAAGGAGPQAVDVAGVEARQLGAERLGDLREARSAGRRAGSSLRPRPRPRPSRRPPEKIDGTTVTSPGSGGRGGVPSRACEKSPRPGPSPRAPRGSRRNRRSRRARRSRAAP